MIGRGGAEPDADVAAAEGFAWDHLQKSDRL